MILFSGGCCFRFDCALGNCKQILLVLYLYHVNPDNVYTNICFSCLENQRRLCKKEAAFQIYMYLNAPVVFYKSRRVISEIILRASSVRKA
jgi:hypothetical protein